MAKKKAVPANDHPKMIKIKTVKKTKVVVKKSKKVVKKSVSKIKIDTNVVFHFKITLVQSRPPIWRRIQIDDCTLDKLHEHIQTAMGWTNSHLHQFEIGGKQYADPLLMEEGMKEFGVLDSTRLGPTSASSFPRPASNSNSNMNTILDMDGNTRFGWRGFSRKNPGGITHYALRGSEPVHRKMSVESTVSTIFLQHMPIPNMKITSTW